jgi:hypothetical protein
MNAWDKVSATCIKNCFKKLSSMCYGSIQEDHDTDHVEKPDDMCEREFNDWVGIDRDLQVSIVLTDKEIAQCTINQSKEKKEGEEENKNEPERIPVSKQQTCKAIGILRRAWEESGATEHEYRLLYTIENSLNRLYANNSKQAKRVTILNYNVMLHYVMKCKFILNMYITV